MLATSSPTQNNFAGLGATGRGEPGESFKDIETGVRAHLEHLLLYAGRPVENPTAERTRKVRNGACSYPGSRPSDGQSPTPTLPPSGRRDRIRTRACCRRSPNASTARCAARPDPRPGLVQEARGSGPRTAEGRPPASPGAELAQRAIDHAKAEGNEQRSALGAQPSPPPSPPFVPFKVLNPPPPADTQTQNPGPAAIKAAAMPDVKALLAPGGSAKAAPADKSSVRTASAAAAAAKAKGQAETPPPATNQKCRVWTASYGGQKALIIRSVVDQVVNYTVLDVNEGSETREAQAFIAAYAKDGKIAGEYGSQAQALDKAFELCPEG